MSIQEFRQQRGQIAAQLKDLVKKPDFDAVTDQATYDTAMAEIDRLDAAIKRVNDANAKLAEDSSLDQIAEAAARIGKNKGKSALTLYAKWLKGGETALNADDWATIRATMSTTTNSEGGFTVQTDVANALLDALKDFGGMREVATVIRTEKGNALNFPTSDGTTEVGEIIAENITATALDPTFGVKSLPVFKYSSKVAAVPWELLQDSSVDIEAFVNNRLVTRLARITNTHFTIGTGTGQPTGVVVAATNGVTAANATSQVTAILYDSIINLIHSVDPAYRAMGNCRFMMNDASVKIVRQIKDTQGRPIFVPGWDNTHGKDPFMAPDSLCGFPIKINQDVPVMAASAKSMLFGDFSYYYVRDAMEISMFRFTDSAYTIKGQVGFLAWLRAGGNFIDVGGAVKTFINAAT